MITKLVGIVVLILLAIYAVRAALRSVIGTKPRTRNDTRQTLVACPRCGAYVPDGKCDCDKSERSEK